MDSVLVHSVHLLSMALLLGGAASAWYALCQRSGLRQRSGVAVARAYEAVFWAAIGAVVITGIGNLGSLAPYVPEPDTSSGAALAFKLALVTALLVLSLGRTLLIERVSDGNDAIVIVLRRSYAITTGLLVVLVLLAGVIVRG